MKRTLAGRAADTYVLASSEKIGAASPFIVLPLAQISGLITDTPTDHPVLQQLQHDGVAIIGSSNAGVENDAVASVEHHGAPSRPRPRATGVPR